ncbi:MAG: zf-HC2 domain-containing protein [Acidobacteriia bacterium]|nr:zf-HC2 domain-containing protein [Terriglobia bacterium]
MNCKQIRERLLDLMDGETGPGELRDHLAGCASCAAELASLRQTMGLLEEWKAPTDLSPYFMTRLRARVREEQARPANWLAWFRKPAWAVTLMVLMVASISLFQGSRDVKDNGSNRTSVALRPGTAVGDLEYLDRNHDLLADFDMLDDLEMTPATVQN